MDFIVDKCLLEKGGAVNDGQFLLSYDHCFNEGNVSKAQICTLLCHYYSFQLYDAHADTDCSHIRIKECSSVF